MTFREFELQTAIQEGWLNEVLTLEFPSRGNAVQMTAFVQKAMESARKWLPAEMRAAVAGLNDARHSGATSTPARIRSRQASINRR